MSKKSKKALSEKMHSAIALLMIFEKCSVGEQATKFAKAQELLFQAFLDIVYHDLIGLTFAEK